MVWFKWTHLAIFSLPGKDSTIPQCKKKNNEHQYALRRSAFDFNVLHVHVTCLCRKYWASEEVYSIMYAIQPRFHLPILLCFPASESVWKRYVARASRAPCTLHVHFTLLSRTQSLQGNWLDNLFATHSKCSSPARCASPAHYITWGLTWHVLNTCITQKLHLSGFCGCHHWNHHQILHMTVQRLVMGIFTWVKSFLRRCEVRMPWSYPEGFVMITQKL